MYHLLYSGVVQIINIIPWEEREQMNGTKKVINYGKTEGKTFGYYHGNTIVIYLYSIFNVKFTRFNQWFGLRWYYMKIALFSIYFIYQSKYL